MCLPKGSDFGSRTLARWTFARGHFRGGHLRVRTFARWTFARRALPRQMLGHLRGGHFRVSY